MVVSVSGKGIWSSSAYFVKNSLTTSCLVFAIMLATRLANSSLTLFNWSAGKCGSSGLVGSTSITCRRIVLHLTRKEVV